MRRPSLGVGAALFALVLFMAACSDDSSTAPESGGSGGQSIDIVDFSFNPSTLTVPSGQDVTVDLTNDGDVEHSFTLDDDSVSQDVEAGEEATVTLNLTEDIGWHCEYHPDQMKGTITVS